MVEGTGGEGITDPQNWSYVDALIAAHENKRPIVPLATVQQAAIEAVHRSRGSSYTTLEPFVLKKLLLLKIDPITLVPEET
jgi:hypothetical protein